MRILSIDYGKRRTGIAVTDPMQIIANGLTTVETKNLFPFLKDYLEKDITHLYIRTIRTSQSCRRYTNRLSRAQRTYCKYV